MYITVPNFKKIAEQVDIDDKSVDVNKILEGMPELNTDIIKDIFNHREILFFNKVHFLFLHMLDPSIEITPVPIEGDKYIHVYEPKRKFPTYHLYRDCKRLAGGIVEDLPRHIQGEKNKHFAEAYREIVKQFNYIKPKAIPIGEDKKLIEEWEQSLFKALEKHFLPLGIKVTLPREVYIKESELFEFSINDIPQAYNRLVELCTKLEKIKEAFPKIYQMRYADVDNLYRTLPKSFYGQELSESQKETREKQMEFANIKEELITLLIMYKAMKENISAQELQVQTLEKFNFIICKTCQKRCIEEKNK